MQLTNLSGFIALRHHLRGAALLRLALAVALLGTLATPSEAVSGSGGTVTNYTQNGTNYRAHLFTSDGTFTVASGGQVEYLMVAPGSHPAAAAQGAAAAMRASMAAAPVVMAARGLSAPSRASQTVMPAAVAVAGISAAAVRSATVADAVVPF